ncbi:MAG: polysaccharide biosynthesis tyrosine autokinase [Myxococcales bacterium]|nr:polysaccharide biosynthesis tyrosine autokinase [Myxococcales bacterium]
MDSAKNETPRAGDAGPRRQTTTLLLQMVRKYWPTALAATTVVVAATAFYTLGQKKIYEAEASVLFNPNPPRPLGSRVEQVVDMGAGSYWNNQEYYETEYRILQSRKVALEVVNELGLQNDLAFLENTPPGEQPRGTATVSPEQAAEALRGRLRVVPVKESRIAGVRFRDADPERAQRLLSAVVDVYIAQNLDTAIESTTSATDWLRGQLDKLKTDLESSEMALHDYKKDKDILSVAFNDQSNMLSATIRQITDDLTRLHKDQEENSARLSQLYSAPTDDPRRIESSEFLKNPLLVNWRGQYESALAEREALLASGKGEDYDAVRAAAQRVETAKAAILREVENVRAAARRDVSAVNQRIGAAEQRLAKARKQAHELNLLEIEYDRLQRQKDNTEKLYGLVLERTKETDLAQLLRVNNIRVLDRPLVPGTPVHPRVPVNIALGLFAGLLLGAAAAFLRGLLDRTIKVPDDLEQELGATFLGLLPVVARHSEHGAVYGRKSRRRVKTEGRPSSPELMVHDQPTSGMAEAARAIRTNLMFMAPDHPYRLLLVTSAGPVEGKTTVACSIAVAMAQAGQRVVLVDCDLRRPRIHRVFAESNDRGVTTVLMDMALDDALVETQVPNLTVITSGPVPPNPAELFHSDRFRRLLEDLKGRFDRVVIDSPPVVAVTDATILSTLVDGTVVVARAFHTRKELARHAVRSIRDVDGKIAGTVLNAVDFSRLEYKYSYYYYQRDEYYGQTGRHSRDASRRERHDETASPD